MTTKNKKDARVAPSSPMRRTGSTATNRNGVIPTSKAKTAYGLLSEVRALILAEPKRLRMSQVLRSDATELWGEEAPACGTVGCVAGWVWMLKVGKGPKQFVCSTAGDILGLTDPQRDALFFDWDMHHLEGTPAHAKSEAEWIERFQRQHAAQLKAKRV
jgi:hypothetical protein